jgi:7-carboxy-7-deazaguanine synthase
VLAIVDEVKALKPRHAVLTGGEPLLFEPIDLLASKLANSGFRITIETAGTIFRDLPCDLMSISPKLQNSIPLGTDWQTKHDRLRINLDALTKLIDAYPVQLKFVIMQPSDVIEIEQLLSSLPRVEPERVLLMPEGRDSAQIWARARELVPLCLDRGWRFTPRLQIDLFGDTRGT